MGKTKRVDISVPEAIYNDVCKWVYTQKYENEPKNSIVLNLLREKQHLSLSEIRNILRNEYGITRRIDGLKRMAEECGIPYKL